MKILHSRQIRIGLLLLASALFVFQFRVLSRQEPQPAQEAEHVKAQDIPLEGLAENDTNGTVPGDPSNGIEDLKKIHSFIVAYRERHQGAYPARAGDILRDIYDAPGSYGIEKPGDAFQAFVNPDSRYADGRGSQQAPKNAIVISYQLFDKRADGTALGTPKQLGTRDLLAFTPMYSHENVRVFEGERSTSNPVGVFLVLWDDGEVEKVPYDKRIFVPQGELREGKYGRWGFAFPGQAGVPANALSYDKFHQKMGATIGPRGEKGSKGKSYNGHTYR